MLAFILLAVLQVPALLWGWVGALAAGFPIGPVGGGQTVGVAGVVFTDTDGLIKGYNVKTGTLISTTAPSGGDAGLVFAALFTAIGTGLVGFYEDLNVATAILPPSGCGVIGAGPARQGTAGPTLTAIATFSGGAVISTPTTAVLNVLVAFVAVNAGTIAARGLSILGTDNHVVTSSAKGGTTEAAKLGGVRTTAVDLDAGNPGAGATQAVTIAGADGIWTNGRIGQGSGACIVFDVASDGWLCTTIHSNGANVSGRNLDLNGDNHVLNAFYVDGTGGTESIRMAAATGLVQVNGMTIRDGGSPGAIPIIRKAGGNLIMNGAVSEHIVSGTGTWSAVCDSSGGGEIFVGCVFGNLATATIAAAFPTRIPTLVGVYLNSTPTNTGVAGTAHPTISVGGPVQDDIATSETTTSATYADLATVGPSITLRVGASGTVMLWYSVSMKGSVAGTSMFASISVDAGVPTDADAIITQAANLESGARVAVVAGLSNGAHTFALQYKSNGVLTLTVASRRLAGVAL